MRKSDSAKKITTSSLRIIGGQWKRRILTFIVVDDLRPTPDRVREAVFSMIKHELPGSLVVDLFAGSGAHAFEAISRGASRVIMVEKNPRIAEVIKNILQETKLSPELLYIELTESNIMENVASGLEILNKLRDIGVFLSLDDFGTGYSSLSYLKKFPIHNLKIDQSFVRDLEKGKQDQEIVKAIIAVAHSLGLTVTAEGIENENQSAFLKSFSCDRQQGYFFSKPLPPDQAIEYLNKKLN